MELIGIKNHYYIVITLNKHVTLYIKRYQSLVTGWVEQCFRVETGWSVPVSGSVTLNLSDDGGFMDFVSGLLPMYFTRVYI